MATYDQVHEPVQAMTGRDEVFDIGLGIGPVGRWFRLFLGIEIIVFLALNSLYFYPVGRHALPGFVLSVAGYFLLIVGVYFGVFALLGKSIQSKVNPWARTAIYVGLIPMVLGLPGLFPQTFWVATGLYFGTSLILLFFMRYGGCEHVALPSLILKRRFTVYCPINAIDAIERAVTPDKSRTAHRWMTVLSMTIVIFVGGYFILWKWDTWPEHHGIGIPIDTRWSLLLLIPCAQLVALSVKHYRAQRAFLAPMVRKYALGAAVLLIAVVVTVFPGHAVSNAVFRAAMGLGAVFALYQVGAHLVQRVAARRRRDSAGPQAPACPPRGLSSRHSRS